MTYEVSRSGPQTWNIALNREHWREQGKVVDDLKTETVFPSRMRHGAQRLDRRAMFSAANHPYGSEGRFSLLSLQQRDQLAEEHPNGIYLIDCQGKAPA